MKDARTSYSTGRASETHAAAYLRDLGYRILAKNVRCPGGELDLVAEDDGVLVFVEVRARRSGVFGDAAESIGSQKRRRTIQAAESYLQEHPADADRPSRIDVVAIQLGGRGQVIALELIRNALEPQ